MAVAASTIARVIGIAATFRDLREGSILNLPQRIAIFAQGASAKSYSLEKFQITRHQQAAHRYGWGSAIHLIARELFPDNGDGVGTIPVTVYPLEDAYEAVAATGSITPSGEQTEAASYRVRIAGILSQAFVVDPDDTMAQVVAKMVAAVNAVLHMPMTAADDTTKMDLTAKWAGVTGNDIVVEVIGPDLGVTFTVSQPSGGLVNPEVDGALEEMGGVWETMGINALGVEDEEALDAFSDFGEGRWQPTVGKPMVVFCGSTKETVEDATSVTKDRRTDRTNAQLVAPGSVNLPFVVAARQVARIAVVANDNPPTGYATQRATGIIPGSDKVQWDHIQRNQALESGSSTIEVANSTVETSQVITFYRPEGEPHPAYRFVRNIVKLQNIIFNKRLIFASPDWAAAPLIPDDQPTANPNARKPRDAKGEINTLIDNLGLAAIISDPETAKTRTKAAIDSQNPNRLNTKMTVQLSGNSDIISAELEFGFFFGQQDIAA